MTATATQPGRHVRRKDYYWLARCEGFRVVTRDGRLGTVFGVEFDAATGALAALRVRSGLLRTHMLEIPIENVLAIDPRRRFVHVRDGEAATDLGLQPS